MTLQTNILTFASIFVLYSISTPSHNNKSHEPEIEINNRDSIHQKNVPNLSAIDFKNLSYWIESRQYKLNDGKYKKDYDFGFDRLKLTNSLELTISTDKYKLIELEHHYGGGSSIMEHYLLVFTVSDNKLIKTGSLQFWKAKNTELKGQDIIVYANNWTKDDSSSFPSLIDRVIFKFAEGNFHQYHWTTEKK